ncbi:hypothetical protein ASPCAL08416 [Aspergillus calidoustus]|uniref:Uncharacterized protein n=1 Tax=Aspergillus calidoustus TaxID=454130 RepID=A0A0U5HJP3_ASPCI|nr:hypothetical protein ASPCAL08416 [Aspergillus calidoustus]
MSVWCSIIHDSDASGSDALTPGIGRTEVSNLARLPGTNSSKNSPELAVSPDRDFIRNSRVEYGDQPWFIRRNVESTSPWLTAALADPEGRRPLKNQMGFHAIATALTSRPASDGQPIWL